MAHLCYVGELHFNAVLIFVSFHCHYFKVAGVEELLTDFCIDAAIKKMISKLTLETLHLRS